MTTDASRSRTIEWQDPAAAFQSTVGRTGLEVMFGLRDGTVPPPPMAVTMNARIIDAAPGRVEFVAEPGEEHYNPLGVVHGGFVCTLLDTVVGCAAHTTLGAGVAYTSIELTVKYLRPITLETGALHATGTVTKGGRRVIFAEGTVTDASGTLLATGSSSLLVLG